MRALPATRVRIAAMAVFCASWYAKNWGPRCSLWKRVLSCPTLLFLICVVCFSVSVKHPHTLCAARGLRRGSRGSRQGHSVEDFCTAAHAVVRSLASGHSWFIFWSAAAIPAGEACVAGCRAAQSADHTCSLPPPKARVAKLRTCSLGLRGIFWTRPAWHGEMEGPLE